jgi:hypothetical protein
MTQVSQTSFGSSRDRAVRDRISLKDALVFGLVAGFSIWILWSFYDVFWYAPDDGAYAYIGSRILVGDVLNRDVQDLHAGYINFINAAALALFGDRMVSMRYPLAGLTLLQSCLTFVLLRPRGLLVAAAGAAGMGALTFVQFLNPTAHWYALFVTVAVIAAVMWMPRDCRWRLPVIGLLLVSLFMFRQLTAVLVAIGFLTYWLCENPRDGAYRFRNRLLARALLLVMGGGLAGYVGVKADFGAALLFGAGPVCLILWALVHGGRENRSVAVGLLHLASGGVVAALPLLLYHLVHRSVGDWLNDTFVAAVALTGLPFFDHARYLSLLMLALARVLSPSGPTAFVNGLYWIVLLLLALAAGTMTLRSLMRKGRRSGMHPNALPVIGTFYAVVSVHYQIPIYLMYSVAVSLAGLLWLASEKANFARYTAVALTGFLILVGLHDQAGQPLNRGIAGIVAGRRAPTPVDSGLAKAGLRIGAEDAATYRRLIALIDRDTPADAPILALPVDPELYFLSGRRNPTRFFNAAIGIPDEATLQAVIATLRRDPPRIVFFRPNDKYNTPRVARLMNFIRARYQSLPPIGGFEIYRYRNPIS